MSIEKIEIICKPCDKCAALIEMITESIVFIEKQHKIKINYKFKFTKHLRDIGRYSVNASKAPLLIINGYTEGAGNMKPDVVRATLTRIHTE
jgi:hypothetical protein